jgi:hypothetical protein
MAAREDDSPSSRLVIPDHREQATIRLASAGDAERAAILAGQLVYPAGYTRSRRIYRVAKCCERAKSLETALRKG